MVKDERRRMGLGSFKALGGVYAVAALISNRWENRYGNSLAPEELISARVKDFARELTFVCASAGNHGLAVAAGAQLFGAKARVHLSSKVPAEFSRCLKDKGAAVVQSGNNYEASMAAAMADTENGNTILLSDSSWNGYSDIPSIVMEGYTVMAEELRSDFAQQGAWPTHVFLQAGVGGLAAAMTYMIRTSWRQQPTIIIVEPTTAPCLRQSAEAGGIVTAMGPESNMGRLDCKDPSHIAVAVLAASDVQYIEVSDQAADDAAFTLDAIGYPTTPSGAAGYAGLLKWCGENEIISNFRPLIILGEAAL
jgi:diaminopropionate ammonia-lyase